MSDAPSARTRIAPLLMGAIRLAAGVLWLLESITKYRAGFGGADIRLVVDSTATNSRVPDFYVWFTQNIMGTVPEAFGVGIPLLEGALGIALLLGVRVTLVAAASIGTLLMYWFADQLASQYPILVALSAVLLVAPAAAGHYGIETWMSARCTSALTPA